MHIAQIPSTLQAKFGESFQAIGDECYEVNTDEFKLLFILSDHLSWLRILTPITTAANADTFLRELLTANFDDTLENRYALHQDVLWGVFQHRLESLDPEDFSVAIERLINLKKSGVNPAFTQFVTQKVREIVRVAKLRGDSLQQTMQTLDRFYAEGMMGDLEEGAAARESMMSAWRYQLTRLWDEE
jgi:Tir chaperone protein (CesT) family